LKIPCFALCRRHRNRCTLGVGHSDPCRCHKLFCAWTLLPEALEGAAALALLALVLGYLFGVEVLG
jgi:hypothetical protein